MPDKYSPFVLMRHKFKNVGHQCPTYFGFANVSGCLIIANWQRQSEKQKTFGIAPNGFLNIGWIRFQAA